MRTTSTLAALAATLILSSPGQTADDQPTTIQFQDQTGTNMTGTVTFKSLTVRTGVGLLVVPIAKIKRISNCNADAHWVHLANGDTLNGRIEEPKRLEVLTELGPVKSDWKGVTDVDFKVREGQAQDVETPSRRVSPALLKVDLGFPVHRATPK
jgi:hypothetical protein